MPDTLRRRSWACARGREGGEIYARRLSGPMVLLLQRLRPCERRGRCRPLLAQLQLDTAAVATRAEAQTDRPRDGRQPDAAQAAGRHRTSIAYTILYDRTSIAYNYYTILH